METSYEAAISEDLDVSTRVDGNLTLQRGVYLVRTLFDELGQRDGAILWKINKPAAPIRLTKTQYDALDGSRLFEKL